MDSGNSGLFSESGFLMREGLGDLARDERSGSTRRLWLDGGPVVGEAEGPANVDW